MNRSILLTILFSLFLISYTSAQQLSSKQQKAIDQLMVDLDQEGQPGAAIAIVRDGQVVYKNAKGTAELAHNVPIQPNTVFQVAELGNQFIAFGALLLAE
ncbi:MAG: serine hydrolase domain-containing protein, partial [Bacteroidota bacterium]